MINKMKSPKRIVTTLTYALFKMIEKSSFISPLMQLSIYNKKPGIKKPRRAYRMSRTRTMDIGTYLQKHKT